MASILQTLAELEEDEHAAIDFDRIRMRVGPSDRAIGRFLIEFLDEAEKIKMTYDTGELMLLLRLGTAIANWPSEGDPEQFLRNPDVREALDSLFWFNIHHQMVNVPQPPTLDICSVWALRPQPYRPHQTYPELLGVSVDAGLQEDYKTLKWTIRCGDNWILDKRGMWLNLPLPSRRTADFHAATQWETVEEALAFAQTTLAKEANLDVEV